MILTKKKTIIMKKIFLLPLINDINQNVWNFNGDNSD